MYNNMFTAAYYYFYFTEESKVYFGLAADK